MRKVHIVRQLALAVALACSAICLHAVNTNGRIKGTITDPSGAVIPNTSVTAINEATGVQYKTASQDNGDYQFLQLPVGTYTIKVTAPGFAQFAATGIVLNIDQQYVEAVKLSLGSSATSVSVDADAVQINTTEMQLSNIVDAKQIVAYPLLGRSFTNLEQILPGVQASNDRFGAFSVNGAQTQQSSYLINGADTNDFDINTIVIEPNLDALDQFNLITGSLNAEYDRNSGGIVSAVVKSGTNSFHGDIFEFYRDTFLNSKNFFQKTPPVYHQNLFGGTIGGPLLRNRLFLFRCLPGQSRQNSSNWRRPRFDHCLLRGSTRRRLQCLNVHPGKPGDQPRRQLGRSSDWTHSRNNQHSRLPSRGGLYRLFYKWTGPGRRFQSH